MGKVKRVALIAFAVFCGFGLIGSLADVNWPGMAFFGGLLWASVICLHRPRYRPKRARRRGSR